MATANFTTFSHDHTDQRDFGNWLSGFCDGEACFMLDPMTNKDRKVQSNYGRAIFIIGLRSDDKPALELIRSFWGVGIIRDRGLRKGSKPQSEYYVNRTADLANVVVRHFETYPLRAKKKNDFEVWRRGVELLYRIAQRPFAYRKYRLPKWTEGEVAEFRSLCQILRDGRCYDAPEFILPEPSEEPNGIAQSLLFD